MIIYKNKDIFIDVFEKKLDVIFHGCNIYCTMGKGIAKTIKKYFPELYQLDKKTIAGDRSKLGTINYIFDSNSKTYIVNAYTQATYWDPKDMLSYEAVFSCLLEIRNTFGHLDRIGMPKIGAGLARGDWNRIEKIIIDVFGKKDVFVYSI